jgi:hypothetical protein
MWVWGFSSGFALRCVALLCAVYMRLHLVVLLAGGPFPLSLSVTKSPLAPQRQPAILYLLQPVGPKHALLLHFLIHNY